MDQLKKEPLGGGAFVYTSGDWRFGADALLLARYAAPRPGETVCELGTGCGVIPLLWCRDGGPAAVDAVEIQQPAAELAARSAAENGLSGRIRVVCADWRKLEGILPAGGYDRVACNPPYYAQGTGKTSRSPAGRLARHEQGDTLPGVAGAAARLLRHGGRCFLCHRPGRLWDLLSALQAGGLEPKRLRFVQQRADKEPWLLLCEARKGGRPGLRVEPVLLLDKTGDGSGQQTIAEEWL